ncbi:MAG: UDP-N-acetylmuramoyl-tripeptide--D-alanyl-D-alanine ligase [Tagaea sp.]|nr:UDP-N-acetylmuramoyl-tripeptide--D-alanyl-D-alanine ligase [Tagaea sp.]
MSALWSSSAAQAATGGKLAGPAWDATGISIDTRTLKPGDLFVALKDARDGHDFVRAAFAQGAAAALVSREIAASGPQLIVPDTLAAMGAMGRAARARANARIVAITGSVGKTSTKEGLALALGRQGATHAAASSFNNHIGVPLTLARLPANDAFAVFEIGMNHAREIAPLTAMVRPHVATITAVEAVHAENFPDGIAGVARAKSEIFETDAGGETAILPFDNPHFEFLAGIAKGQGWRETLGFGTRHGSAARLIDWQGGPDGSTVTAEILGKRIVYRVGAPGAHWASNSLAIVLSAHALGADFAQAAAALADADPPKGRGARHEVALPAGGAFTLLDESYNASPPSMRAAFAVLAMVPATRRIAVLGDMRELGPDAEALHAGLADALEANGVDLVFACGPLMRRLHDALPERRRGAHAADSAALLPAVLQAVRPGDAITVKGSLGSRMAPIVSALLELDPARARPRAAAGR